MLALYIAGFLLFCIFILYPWGSLILRSEKNPILRINVGVVFSVVVYFILGFFKLNFLTIPVLSFPALYLIVKMAKGGFTIPKIKFDWLVVFVVVLTALLQASINFTSGPSINGSLTLVNSHQNDSMWFVALTESIKRGIPPANPGYPETLVQNYHFFTNIFVAESQLFTNIPTATLYLKIISPFLLVLLSFTTYLFFKKLTGSKWVSLGGVLLTGLSSNLYYLVGVFYSRSSLSPSIFWVNEYETRIVNYHLLISYVILTTLFYLLIQRKRSLWLIGILAGSLIAFKSFASVLLLPSLSLIALFGIFKRNYFYLRLVITAGILNLLLYLSINPIPNSLFIFQPLYLIQTMMITDDHINYPDWILKIQTYLAENNYKRVIQLYTEGIAIFLIGNLGIRILGVATLFQRKINSRKREVTWLMLSIAGLGVITGLLFVFKGIAWNTIQFFYYTVFTLSILTIYEIGIISKKHKLLAFILFVIGWISLIPGVFYITKDYLSKISSSQVAPGIVRAASFLSKQKSGTVLVNPAYATTSLIAALTGHATFLTNGGILDMELINHDAADKDIKAFFENKDINLNFLSKYNIKYILTDTKDLPRYKTTVTPVIYTSDNIVVLRFDNPDQLQ